MRRPTIAVAAALLALSGCGGTESVKQAGPEIARFHTRLDNEAYGEIWTAAGQDLHRAAKQEQFEKFLKAVHTKLGKVQASKQIGWRVNANTNGRFAEVSMDTKFEKGAGRETFVYRIDGENLALAGYFINSTDMMIN